MRRKQKKAYPLCPMQQNLQDEAAFVHCGLSPVCFICLFTTQRAVKSLAANTFLSNLAAKQTNLMGLHGIVHLLPAPKVPLPSHHSSCRIVLKHSLICTAMY